eukprot:TRINITY_DN1605_c0_g1_i1.p1 TRINITY_DN1605_c0_g1~~TRINITY_DN1605_c0_g1_i1.p1  ORF type:complete len:784 (-),score=148.13 TRINITY_DN1605_c0_g1_i1:41-2392(-)
MDVSFVEQFTTKNRECLCDFSDRGFYLLENSTLKYYNFETKEEFEEAIPITEEFIGLHVSNDDEYICICTKTELYVRRESYSNEFIPLPFIGDNISVISFNFDNSMLAIGYLQEVHIVSTLTLKTVFTLRCPSYIEFICWSKTNPTLVCTGDDQCVIRVFDFALSSLTFEKEISPTRTILNMYCHPFESLLYILDSMLTVTVISLDKPFSTVLTKGLGRYLERIHHLLNREMVALDNDIVDENAFDTIIISAVKKDKSCTEDVSRDFLPVSNDVIVLDMGFFSRENTTLILILTQRGIASFHASTLDLCELCTLNNLNLEILPNIGCLENEFGYILNFMSKEIYLFETVFQKRSIHDFNIRLKREDIPASSMLFISSQHDTRNAQTMKSKDKGTKNKSRDKPVTFNRKIRSSGYGVTHAKQKMFSLPKDTKTSRNKVTKSKPVSPYPMNCSLLTNINDDWTTLVDGNNALTYHSFVASGGCLIAVTTDGSIIQQKMPAFRHKQDMTAHLVGKSIHSLAFASTNDYFSSFNSNSIEFLKPFRQKSLLTINGSNFKGLTNHVCSGTWLFNDKLFCFGNGNQIPVLRLKLSEDVNDLDRNQINSTFQIKGLLTHENTNAIKCMTAPKFESQLLLSGGTNKSLVLHDLIAEQPIYHLENAAERPFNQLLFCCEKTKQHSLENIFLSANAMDGVRLWDIRTAEPILRFQVAFRSQSIFADVSPCGRYIAAGGEDGYVSIFDIQNGDCLSRQKHHRGVASCVSFHPFKPFLSSVGFDNSIIYSFSEDER